MRSSISCRGVCWLWTIVFILVFGSISGAEEWTKVISSDSSGIGKKLSTTSSSAKMSASNVFAKASSAVVTVVIKIKGKVLGHGSGFFIRENGYILTNNHVVDLSDYGEYASSVTFDIVTKDEKTLKAEVVKTDPEIDLALLKVRGRGYPVIELGDAGQVEVGDDVFVIGTPVRLEFSQSITEGIISGRDRSKGRLQSSVVIHGGNSGGPALNSHGKVIGVAVAVAASPEMKTIMIEGMGAMKVAVQEAKHGISYLVPINFAKNLTNLMF